MKKFITALLIIFITYSNFAQCDSLDYEMEGEFITNTVKNPVIKINKGDWEPSVGRVVEISKYFETKIFGFNSTGWMSIAKAKVTKNSDKTITVQVIEELSDVTVNGKKKNQFEKGNLVKVVWRGKAQTVVHLEMEGTDTTVFGHYLCGVRSGEWKWYSDGNKVEATEYYVNGKLQGPVRDYYESGALKYESTYVDDKKNGKTNYYFENGKIQRTLTYIDGKKEGTTTKYYESGEIQYTENHKAGVICCQAKDFYENGKVKIVANYNDNGKFHGEFKVYTENGNLKYERVYQNGEKTGAYKSYHDNGKPFILATTINDTYDGNYKEYYNNGNLKFNGNYNEGIETGNWKEYYENGKLHIHGDMVKGEKVGYWESFYEDGTPKSKGTYDQEGNKIGKWFTWSTSGKKSKTKY